MSYSRRVYVLRSDILRSDVRGCRFDLIEAVKRQNLSIGKGGMGNSGRPLHFTNQGAGWRVGMSRLWRLCMRRRNNTTERDGQERVNLRSRCDCSGKIDFFWTVSSAWRRSAVGRSGSKSTEGWEYSTEAPTRHHR